MNDKKRKQKYKKKKQIPLMQLQFNGIQHVEIMHNDTHIIDAMSVITKNYNTTS